MVLDTTVPTAVEAISGNENIEIVSRTFYSIDGKVIDEPQNGMFIEKALYSDGSIKTVKKYRR